MKKNAHKKKQSLHSKLVFNFHKKIFFLLKQEKLSSYKIN